MRDPFTHRRTRRSSDSNPYVERSFQHPGRLFVFDDADSDTAAVRALLVERDVYCDLGSGSGMHLLGLATRSPQANFFGFEIRYKRSVRTLEKAIEAGLDNVFVLRIRAEAINWVFPQASIKGIYVNFPDPWAKQKKTKKRMLHTGFLNTLAETLTPGGFVALKTDHKQYYEWFLSQAEASDKFKLFESTSDLYASEFIEDNIPTEFESLFVSKSMPIHYAKLVV